MPATKKQIIQILKMGGLVVIPSDTVYGLAVDATQSKAVEKLLKFKERWPGKAIAVFCDSFKMASDYAIINNNVQTIYTNWLPGPFTLIVEGRHRLAKGIEAEDGSLGIRIPNYPLIIEVVKEFGRPITATSANLSGHRPHYSTTSFLKTLSEKKRRMIDLIVDVGKLPRNKPSTVVDIREPKIKILRRGDFITPNGQTFISHSAQETQKIAGTLLSKIPQPIILGLSGDLGTGKTVFSQGISRAMGIKEKITSPTFTIYNDYGKFLHIDLYRINNQEELTELNIFNAIKNKKVVCIEWIENLGKTNLVKLTQIAPLKFLTFKYIDEHTREIKL